MTPEQLQRRRDAAIEAAAGVSCDPPPVGQQPAPPPSTAPPPGCGPAPTPPPTSTCTRSVIVWLMIWWISAPFRHFDDPGQIRARGATKRDTFANVGDLTCAGGCA